jgi:hypothetical protein
MLKQNADRLLAITALAAFIILAIYLLIQDTSSVGPI